MSINLRPHHGMCFQFYEGKGYSEDFTDHMGRIIMELENNPEELVRLSCAVDVVCKNCPNNENGVCTTLEKVTRYDREVLEAVNLHDGDEISYDEFSELVRKNIIDAGIRRDICGDCCWDSICHSHELKLKS